MHIFVEKQIWVLDMLYSFSGCFPTKEPDSPKIQTPNIKMFAIEQIIQKHIS